MSVSVSVLELVACVSVGIGGDVSVGFVGVSVLGVSVLVECVSVSVGVGGISSVMS